MFRDTQVIVTDTDTGAAYIRNVCCPIPEYDIGQTVGLTDPDNPKGTIESDIVGISIQYEVIDGELKTFTVYSLANKVEVFEEDIEYFWEVDDEVIDE